ncbi:MAG: BTAD domain-containing putative transcriptional regulator [Spirochaetota bacterium]|nr:BTAD domain-containing putative transcriptional regulator [Spirochaetota bacterium]
MHQRIQILNSKLLLPHLSDTIQRERLHPLLAKIPRKRLTTVTAGAGFGKTTLVAEACNLLGLNSVWYRLDKSDSDFITFISYLIAGIQKHIREFGIETHQRIGDAQILSRERKAVLTVFLSEIEKLVKGDLIIVIDDYHFIQDSQEINELIEYFLENIPPQVHLIIISRADSGLSISLLRARRQVLEIKEDDLVLSIPEIERLYSQLFNIALETQSLEILHRKTEGWVSGLILFYHSLHSRNPTDVEILLSRLQGSHKIISDYLEENVYELQSDEIKSFLIKTSILSYIDVDFCNQLLGIENSGGILRELEEKHLFTFPLDEEREWYYYHHLFSEFLQKKLASELGRKAILNLHKHAAIAMEKLGKDEEAMRHYFMAEQLDEAGILFKKVGDRLLKEKRLQVIESYFNKIPKSLLNSDPWIQFMQAESLALAGKPKDAINAYKISRKMFYRDANLDGVVSSLHQLGSNYFIDGDLVGAESAFLELLTLQKSNSGMYIDVLTNLVMITTSLGKFDLADKYFDEAMLLLSSTDGIDNKRILARLYFNHGHRYILSGDNIKAMRTVEKMKEICENLKLPLYSCLSYYLISVLYYSLGDFSKSLDNAKKGLDLAIKNRIRETCWLFGLSAFNHAKLGNISEAIIDGKESLRISQHEESRYGQGYAYLALYHAYVKSSNPIEAEESLNSGVNVIHGRNLPLLEGELKARLAEFQIGRGRWEEARHLLEDAEKLLIGAKLQISMVYLIFARLYWEQNQRDEALSKLMSGLQLSEANQYDAWIISEKQWIVPLLVELFIEGKMQDYLQGIFKGMGLSAPEELAHLQNNKNHERENAGSKILDAAKEVRIPNLRVYCLGKFRVYRGDEEITAESWKSKKRAKMLLIFFVHNRSRGYLPRDLLMEFLWPEEDPRKTIYRIHDTLASLRKTLEPGRKRGTPSSYILRAEEGYKVDLGENDCVDVDEFRDIMKLAEDENNSEKKIAHYLKAEEVYSGDYLEEYLYIDWCLEERERLRQEYLNLLIKIIEHFEKSHDYFRCVEFARRYLNKDKFAEKVYQRLMRYYSYLDNRAMLTKTYERCKDNIIKELKMPLSKETEMIFNELLLKK